MSNTQYSEESKQIAEQLDFETVIEAMVQNHFKLTPPAGTGGYTFHELCYGSQIIYHGLLDEYNELVGQLEDRDKTILDLELKVMSNEANKRKLASLEREITNQKQQAEKTLASANAKANETQSSIETAIKREQAAIKRVKELERELEKERKGHNVTKNDLNRAQSQVKRLKASSAELKAQAVPGAKKKIAALAEATRTLQAEVSLYQKSQAATAMPSFVGSFHNLYSDGTNVILFLDKPVIIQLKNGVERKQYTLLFSCSKGTYYTYCLGEENYDRDNPKFHFSEFRDSRNASEEEYQILGKFEPVIPEHIVTAMNKWLIKVNVDQGGELLPEDFDIKLKDSIHNKRKAAA